VSYGELERLFEQFFALVEAKVRLPPGLERRTAFRDVRDYGARVDQIATRILKQDLALIAAPAPLTAMSA
jgi:hypothetical protein